MTKRERLQKVAAVNFGQIKSVIQRLREGGANITRKPVTPVDRMAAKVKARNSVTKENGKITNVFVPKGQNAGERLIAAVN